MRLSDFRFDLPADLIAQHPLPEREGSRMMVIDRSKGTWSHRRFEDLPDILDPSCFLVINNTRVFPARLRARRPGRSEAMEVLLLQDLGGGTWRVLVRPGRKAKPGQILLVAGLQAEVMGEMPDGSRQLRFREPDLVHARAEDQGEPPLPPYIRRNPGENLDADRSRYQTVYARHSGSVAAPTAGLHFSPEIFDRLEQKGIRRVEILLHVGYGTFQPVRCEQISKHRMEAEYCEISTPAASFIRSEKQAGKRLIAVGTTTTRTLEHWAGLANGLGPYAGYCDLFICPGYEFRLLDGLLTNFHLPCSTLLMLVCAFAGYDLMMECYREAVRCQYRFFSYGDCMLIQ